MSRTAPGPRARLLLGNVPEFQADPLGFLAGAVRAHGDVVRLSFGPFPAHFLRHPDDIQWVLQTNRDNYRKQTRTRAALGKGVATLNGEPWRRDRRRLRPMFDRSTLPIVARATLSVLGQTMEAWEGRARRREAIEVVDEMMRLAFLIVGEALFGSDVGPGLEQARAALSELRTLLGRRIYQMVPLPLWVPTPANVMFRRARSRLDANVHALLAERRARESPSPDLLSHLLSAGLDHRELRDETVTLLAAGHENSGHALAWVWHLLATHGDVAARLRTELSVALGGRAPEWSDVPALAFTRLVLQECLRLYPPGWIIRVARREDAIRGFRIPARSLVLVSPYLTHRHPDFWPEPEAFWPERFAASAPGSGHPFAFIPFGGGRRTCLGGGFAETEAILVIAAIAHRFRLRHVPGHSPVEPYPLLSLAPRHPLWMLVERTGPPGASSWEDDIGSKLARFQP